MKPAVSPQGEPTLQPSLRVTRRDVLKGAAATAVLTLASHDLLLHAPQERRLIQRIEQVRLWLAAGSVLTFPDPRFYTSTWVDEDARVLHEALPPECLGEQHLVALEPGMRRLTQTDHTYRPGHALFPALEPGARVPNTVLAYFRSIIPFIRSEDITPLVVVTQEILPPRAPARVRLIGDQWLLGKTVVYHWSFRRGYLFETGHLGMMYPPLSGRGGGTPSAAPCLAGNGRLELAAADTAETVRWREDLARGSKAAEDGLWLRARNRNSLNTWEYQAACDLSEIFRGGAAPAGVVAACEETSLLIPAS